MIQFNLLPDVKQEYIKTARTKRTAMAIAGIVSAFALALVIILFLVVNVVQRTHLNNLSSDIEASSKRLEETPDLNKILTVQNQLNNLTALHDGKPQTSRLFGFVTQVTPAKASISELNIDYTTNTMEISGAADTLQTVNKFVDTLKFTTYTAGEDQKGNAFSEVVLASFGRSEEEATYQITLKFDPIIFDNNAEVKLAVPNIITTRSSTERPEAVFQSEETGGAQ